MTSKAAPKQRANKTTYKWHSAEAVNSASPRARVKTDFKTEIAVYF
jgi:hypothetical protein